jgi:L-threonylcarbamoyladenylate synthase
VDIGLESTVIDMTRNPSVILRPGKVTKNQIESIIGKLGKQKKSDKESPKCPGMKYKHYSPNALVVIIKEGENEEEMAKNYLDKKVRILKYKDEEEMAKNLFKDFEILIKKNLK